MIKYNAIIIFHSYAMQTFYCVEFKVVIVFAFHSHKASVWRQAISMDVSLTGGDFNERFETTKGYNAQLHHYIGVEKRLYTLSTNINLSRKKEPFCSQEKKTQFISFFATVIYLKNFCHLFI